MLIPITWGRALITHAAHVNAMNYLRTQCTLKARKNTSNWIQKEIGDKKN